MLEDFKKFILRGNVVDLAVGVVIGASFNNVVSSLVKDVVTPFVGIFGGLPNFETLTLTIGKSTFMVGEFINNLISFLIIATVVYFFVVVPMNRLNKVMYGEVAKPKNKKCPFCLSSIPEEAKKCAFCTADLHNSKKH